MSLCLDCQKIQSLRFSRFIAGERDHQPSHQPKSASTQSHLYPDVVDAQHSFSGQIGAELGKPTSSRTILSQKSPRRRECSGQTHQLNPDHVVRAWIFYFYESNASIAIFRVRSRSSSDAGLRSRNSVQDSGIVGKIISHRIVKYYPDPTAGSRDADDRNHGRTVGRRWVLRNNPDLHGVAHPR